MVQGTQRHSKRAFWFVSILFALLLCATVVGAMLSIQSSKESMLRDVRSRLEAEARTKTAALTVWYGGLQNRVEGLTRTDMFRLFASEVNGLGDAVDVLLLQTPEEDRTEYNSTAHELASQLPLMRKILDDFVAFSGFASARMLNRELQDYLFTGGNVNALTPEQRQTVTEVFVTGKSAIAPVRMTQEGLVLDIVSPVFAPAYISPENRTASVLLLSYRIRDKIQELTITGENSFGDFSRIAQRNGGTLQDLRPDGVLAVLEDWTHMGEGLPLKVRRIDASSLSAYSLGIDVPGMPWTIVQSLSQDKAESAFRTYRKFVILVACGMSVFFLLLLGLFWWWLVWRRERAVSKEITMLYNTVNQQKQLLDGINSTFPVGIALTDSSGVIRYANTALAEMLGHTPETLPGLSILSLFVSDATETLGRHLQTVFQQGVTQSFTEELRQSGKKETYQIVCAPFRDEENRTTGVVSAFQNITEVVEAQERSQHMVRQTITVLVRAIEAVDPYLRGQSTHTGTLAGNLVKAMGLGPVDRATVLTSANLFQIGMIQLPHTLLNKQGQHTPEERVQLERHVDYAREVLAGMDFGMPVLETICQMYERLDGSGYPKHLKGDQIGMHARILAVANTFCALVRPRSYRMAKSVSDALGILSEEPPHFDPQIVELLRAFLNSQEGEFFVKMLQEKHL